MIDLMLEPYDRTLPQATDFNKHCTAANLYLLSLSLSDFWSDAP